MPLILFILYLVCSPLPWSIAVSLASVSAELITLPKAILLVWLIGFIEDASLVRPLGLTSFILISCVFITWLLSTRYRAYARWWSLLVGTLGQLVIMNLMHDHFSLLLLIGQWLTIIVFIFIRQKLFDRDGIYVGI